MPKVPEGADEIMKTFYLSLCRGLVGYYVKFIAPDEDTVRCHAAKYFGRLWCSVYTEAYFYEVLKRRYPNNSRIINKDRPIELTGDEGDWE